MADKDLVSVQQARDLVEAAHRAQAQLARFDQAKIDRVCEAMARAAFRSLFGCLGVHVARRLTAARRQPRAGFPSVAALRPAPAVGCVSRASGHNIMCVSEACQTYLPARFARVLNFAARGATVALQRDLSEPVFTHTTTEART